ncbi:MAG: hypothetical protein JXQ30_08735 [Spirochaetes bacterium]|nr:hypothetical protein [Spirochaetota bacterium]
MARYMCMKTNYKHATKTLYERGEFYEFDKNPGKHFKQVGKPKEESHEKNIDAILEKIDSLEKQKASLENKIEKDPKDTKSKSTLESVERKIAALEKAIQG